MWKFFTNNSRRSEQSDEELIASYKKTGNKDFIAELYDRYAQHLFGFCMKYLKDEELAKDVVAEVFYKLFDDLIRFDIKKFRAWFLRVTYNACMDKLIELKKSYSFVDVNLIENIAIENESEENDLPNDLSVEMGLASLKVEQRICIEQFYFKRKTYQEISLDTDYPINKVKSYIQNGKRNLESYFRENHGK